jgi:hypothetical protein
VWEKRRPAAFIWMRSENRTEQISASQQNPQQAPYCNAFATPYEPLNLSENGSTISVGKISYGK